jgi:hypothetical protein
VLAFDEELIALRLLADRRDELSALRVQTVNRLHRLFTELIPGGAPKYLSATKAQKLLAGVRPRTLVGKTTRRMAAEELADLVRVDSKLKALNRELKAAVLARGSHLRDLHGIGPPGPRGSWPTSATSSGSPTATTSRPGPAPHPWTPPAASTSAIGCPAPRTGGSTTSSTSLRSPRSARTARVAATTGASWRRPRRPRKRCGA